MGSRIRPDMIREIITSTGFEEHFRELGEMLAAGGHPDFERIMALSAFYGLTLHMERPPR